MVLWQRLLVGSGIALSLLMGLVGFAHTQPGRPLRPMLVALQQVTGGKSRGACPLGYDRSHSPAEVEAARRRLVAELKGTAPSPQRPALVFSLGQTIRSEVEAWARDHGVPCHGRQGPQRLVCAAVPGEALPVAIRALGVEEVYFQFDPAQRLVSVGTIRASEEASAAVEAQEAIVAELRRQLGDPSSHQGEASATYLQGGLLRQARTEFRFSDYYATSSVTTMGTGRYVVSERYELLADGS
ncbi:MAG: hypothetical protein RMJ98_20340 [Myxococcales bacterium]|nr:hypothetical protein [Polyangiaceae bacterium]MDW8251651.1 hypothetical protein [Myxococcales bacterium]